MGIKNYKIKNIPQDRSKIRMGFLNLANHPVIISGCFGDGFDFIESNELNTTAKYDGCEHIQISGQEIDAMKKIIENEFNKRTLNLIGLN